MGLGCGEGGVRACVSYVSLPQVVLSQPLDSNRNCRATSQLCSVSPGAGGEPPSPGLASGEATCRDRGWHWVRGWLGEQQRGGGFWGPRACLPHPLGPGEGEGSSVGHL